jgi:hypothetical protein
MTPTQKKNYTITGLLLIIIVQLALLIPILIEYNLG